MNEPLTADGDGGGVETLARCMLLTIVCIGGLLWSSLVFKGCEHYVKDVARRVVREELGKR